MIDPLLNRPTYSGKGDVDQSTIIHRLHQKNCPAQSRASAGEFFAGS
jgi:hypothetical protein